MKEFIPSSLDPLFQNIKSISEKYYQRVPLTAEEVQKGIAFANEYYSYLAECGITYGYIALDVLNNKPGYGKFANLHLFNSAKKLNISEVEIQKISNNIPVFLAIEDIYLRYGNKEIRK